MNVDMHDGEIVILRSGNTFGAVSY